jgi:hypothetical protein
MRRESYHQSVFDLLDIQPPHSVEARAMIEAWESRHGRRLLEAVRQWYLIENLVALQEHRGDWPRQNAADHLWYDYSNEDQPEPLEQIPRQFAQEYGEGLPSWGPDRVRVLVENQGVCSWFIQPDGSDDPPVVVDEYYDYHPAHPEESKVLEWVKVADHFSDFVFDWFAGYYYRDWPSGNWPGYF